MPRLKDRIGHDCVAKLERAVQRRYAEARMLQEDEPLGAIYLYGYTFEMRLKSAAYRLAGIPIAHDIQHHLPALGNTPRHWAETRVRNLLTNSGIPLTGPIGHHLLGWALLVQDLRVISGLPHFAPVFQQDLTNHTDAIWDIWTEALRYKANKPYNFELGATALAARWLKQNYSRLWS